jgi:hypothetical protein
MWFIRPWSYFGGRAAFMGLWKKKAVVEELLGGTELVVNGLSD